MSKELRNIEVVILCGGLGTRIAPVIGETPKVLASIGNRIFLDLLLEMLADQGFCKFIFCVGRGKEDVKNYVRNAQKNISFSFSEEEKPLGTGGAVKKSLPLISGSQFLVLNGDTICRIKFAEFFQFHQQKKAIVSMALARSERQDGGSAETDKDGMIIQFGEKQDPGKRGYISAGAYFMQRDVYKYMPDKEVFSLEHDVFPGLIGQNFFGFSVEYGAYDIGTPDRYHEAPKHLL